MEELNLQVKFTEETNFGPLTDAIYISYSEYQDMSVSKREEWKEEKISERIAKYEKYRQNIIDNPPLEEEGGD